MPCLLTAEAGAYGVDAPKAFALFFKYYSAVQQISATSDVVIADPLDVMAFEGFAQCKRGCAGVRSAGSSFFVSHDHLTNR